MSSTAFSDFFFPKDPLVIKSRRLAEKRDFASHLRRFQTDHELKLWERLKGKRLGFPVLQQQILLGYIVDFYCPHSRTVVEVDGSIHDKRKAYDARRDKRMRDFGHNVMRFTNHQVDHDIEFVVRTIREAKTPTGRSPICIGVKSRAGQAEDRKRKELNHYTGAKHDERQA